MYKSSSISPLVKPITSGQRNSVMLEMFPINYDFFDDINSSLSKIYVEQSLLDLNCILQGYVQKSICSILCVCMVKIPLNNQDSD